MTATGWFEMFGKRIRISPIKIDRQNHYAYDNAKKVGTITYSASKLTDDTGTNKTFTWTLSNAEIN